MDKEEEKIDQEESEEESEDEESEDSNSQDDSQDEDESEEDSDEESEEDSDEEPKEKVDLSKQRELFRASIKAKELIDAEVSTEMRDAYLNYAMSVIVARAIPAAEDGLKPVHRRILWAMNELPRVSNPNNGIMRRVKIIEFPPLPESEKDINLKEYIKKEGLESVTNANEIEEICKKVLKQNQKAIDEYKNGNEKSFMFLVGQCMRELKGKADPKILNEILKKLLK